MDGYLVERRTALLFGLRREDVRYVAREGEGSCYHAVALLLPNECVSVAQELTDAMNDAVNTEASLGDEHLSDLWGARHFRFMAEAKWYEKIMAAYFPRVVERKYASLTRDLVFMGQAGEGETSPAGEGQCAVVIVTSYRRDGQHLNLWQHDAERTQAILLALEAHEEALRTIIRKAVPSHHLLAAPTEEEAQTNEIPAVSEPRKAPQAQTRFVFSPVFTEAAPASVKISV